MTIPSIKDLRILTQNAMDKKAIEENERQEALKMSAKIGAENSYQYCIDSFPKLAESAAARGEIRIELYRVYDDPYGFETKVLERLKKEFSDLGYMTYTLKIERNNDIDMPQPEGRSLMIAWN